MTPTNAASAAFCKADQCLRMAVARASSWIGSEMTVTVWLKYVFVAEREREKVLLPCPHLLDAIKHLSVRIALERCTNFRDISNDRHESRIGRVLEGRPMLADGGGQSVLVYRQRNDGDCLAKISVCCGAREKMPILLAPTLRGI